MYSVYLVLKISIWIYLYMQFNYCSFDWVSFQQITSMPLIAQGHGSHGPTATARSTAVSVNEGVLFCCAAHVVRQLDVAPLGRN